jgi:hypothetical protein
MFKQAPRGVVDHSEILHCGRRWAHDEKAKQDKHYGAAQQEQNQTIEPRLSHLERHSALDPWSGSRV